MVENDVVLKLFGLGEIVPAQFDERVAGKLAVVLGPDNSC